MCAVYETVVKDFQSNLNNFVNQIQNFAISTQNLAKIIQHVDPNQQIVTKSVPAILDWSQNLYILAEKFENDFKQQFEKSYDKEPESCIIRMTMGNVYEKVLFFLNHMTHSFVDYSRSESPMSASNYDCQSLLSTGPLNSVALQRFRILQHQQQYRRWSEAACTMEHQNETNIDANRRWSMPSNVNVSKSRLNVIPKTLVTQCQQPPQQSQTFNDSDGVFEAIQLLSLRVNLPSRPPSQQIPQPFHRSSQAPTSQSQQQTTRQRQSRAGGSEEILILPRGDPLYLGRYQQIAEEEKNVRGETDEY